MVSDVVAAAGLKLELCRSESIYSASSFSPHIVIVLDNLSTTWGHERPKKDDILSHAHGMRAHGVASMNRLFFWTELIYFHRAHSKLELAERNLQMFVFLEMVVDNWSTKK